MYFCYSKKIQNLGQAKEFIWQYCVKNSETFHVPEKYEKSNTTKKVSVFTQHTSNMQCKHPKAILRTFYWKQDYK